MSIFLGTLSTEAQWASSGATVHTQVQEKRNSINSRACSGWASSDCKELSLRQVQAEQPRTVGSHQALLFKPHSSTQLSTGGPF